MAWSIEYSGLALKQLKKLNRSIQAEILDYMDNRIAPTANPRDFGKSLRHDKFGLWRYRVGDYRIICELDAYTDEAGHAFQYQAGHLFRFEGGHRTDMKPATLDGLMQVGLEDLFLGSGGQVLLWIVVKRSRGARM